MSVTRAEIRLSRRRVLHWALVAGSGLLAACAREQKIASPSVPIAPPAGFANSDGFRIHYETFGDGDPIILVHGWGSSLKDNWVSTGWIETLRPMHRVVALDVRGHGDSDKPHEQAAYSYARMSRDVLHVMDHLGIAKAGYVGYSMGAFMGASLLGHARDRFSSMILGGIGDETDESLAALPKIVAGLRAKDREQISDPVSLGYRSFADADPRNDLEALALSALQMWPEGFPLQLGGPGLAAVDIPVLIVNGANDHPYIDTVHKLVDAIPSAQLAVISGRDHLNVVSDPRFAARAVAFLADR